jgi:hypothetical protein
MRYAPGHKGPTLPGPTKNPNDPRLGSPRPRGRSNAADPKPFRPLAPAVSTRPPGPAPTGPMTPVRGGGMAPASVATMMKKGGKVKCMAKGGSASKRADGIAKQGKTKGKII